MTLNPWVQWRSQARQMAQDQGIPPEEVDQLLAAGVGWSRLDQHLQQGLPPAQELPRIQALWQTRWRERVPLQYLLGRVHWRDLELQVAPGVLIPRPETELLVDVALASLGSHPQPPGLWLDLGTGSGAVAIALAQQALQVPRIYGIDISSEALTLAAANVKTCGVEARVHLLQGSWFEPLDRLSIPAQACQGMVANPPYIPSAQIPYLPPEVSQHEPRLALDGGMRGIEIIEHLITQAPRYLRSGGFWAVEVMAGQAEEVMAQLRSTGHYTQICCHLDLSGIARIVSAQLL